MRLIDADKIVYRDVIDSNWNPSGHRVAYMRDIEAMPAIDQELLPIVKEKLEMAEEERDKAIAEAKNARQSLLMAMFSKCEFLVKFDEFGKSVQLVQKADKSEQTIKIDALSELKAFCESKAEIWAGKDPYASGVRDALKAVCAWIDNAQAGEDHDA